MKFVSAGGMREGEQRAILADSGLNVSMMDQAGKGLALVLARRARQSVPPVSVVRMLAGPGNNGGDVFSAAFFLQEWGLRPEVWLVVPEPKIKGASRECYDRMIAAGVPCRELSDELDWDLLEEEPSETMILVDGLLGTGAKGEPAGILRRVVDYVRAQSQEHVVVAVDIPTGMDADTGVTPGIGVQADLTVTMGFPKVGMSMAAALENLGSLVSVPIGLPGEFAEAIPDARPDLQWISAEDVKRSFSRRRRDSHKGMYGRTLLMGGSAFYPGAVVLAAEGAIRSGVGLVQVATVETAAAPVLSRVPEAILGERLSADISLVGMDSIMAGPGLGRDPEARRLVARLLHETPCPLVLDADALAVLEGKPEVLRQCAQPVVITPHPGELAKLLGKSVDDIQGNRQAAAHEAAERSGATVVLKGSGTLVAKMGQPTWINLNGNPGMACGGSGDVLAGLLAGLLAQGLEPVEAACAAVWLHGTAGDLTSWKSTQAAMKASDIAYALPGAFRQVCTR